MFKYLVKFGINTIKGDNLNKLKILKTNHSIIWNNKNFDRKYNIQGKHFSNIISQDQPLEEEVVDNLKEEQDDIKNDELKLNEQDLLTKEFLKVFFEKIKTRGENEMDDVDKIFQENFKSKKFYY